MAEKKSVYAGVGSETEVKRNFGLPVSAPCQFGITWDQAIQGLVAFAEVLNRIAPMRRELLWGRPPPFSLWCTGDGAFRFYSLECLNGALCWLPSSRFWRGWWWDENLSACIRKS